MKVIGFFIKIDEIFYETTSQIIMIKFKENIDDEARKEYERNP